MKELQQDKEMISKSEKQNPLFQGEQSSDFQSIEYLLNSKNQEQIEYEINQQGVSNRGKLFEKKSTEEANFFMKSKLATNHEFGMSPLGTEKEEGLLFYNKNQRDSEKEIDNNNQICSSLSPRQYKTTGIIPAESTYIHNYSLNQITPQQSQKLCHFPSIDIDSQADVLRMRNLNISRSHYPSKNQSLQSQYNSSLNGSNINISRNPSIGFNLKDTNQYQYYQNSPFNTSTNQPAFQIQNQDKLSQQLIMNKYKYYLISLTYMKKFLNQLLLNIAYKDYRILQKSQMEMIGDKSITDPSYISKKFGLPEDKEAKTFNILSRRNNILHQKMSIYEREVYYRLNKRVFSFFHNMIYHFWMKSKALEPSALIIIIWEIYFLLLLIGQVILIPIKGCFQSDFLQEDNFAWILYNIPIGCFLIDIVIGFHIGYYQFGMAVMDKKLIAIQYLKHKFWIDFSCTLLLSSNLYFKSTLLEFLAMFLRTNQMKMKMEKIDQRFQISYRIPVWSQIFKLIMIIIFLAHLCGCGFHFVGDKSGSIIDVQIGNVFPTNYRSWIHQQGLEDKDWSIRYIFALYFSIISMITIGYGDITPINKYEKIYVIGITFITCGTFAYCLNTIGNIFAQEEQKYKQFKQNQYMLQSYLDYLQTPKDTQLRVLKYFEYLNEQSDETVLKGAQVFEECSKDLKEEVIRGSYIQLLLQIPLLRKSFSKDFLLECTTKMQEKRFGPGEILSQKDQKLSQLMIITKGEVEYYFQAKNDKKSIHLTSSKAIDAQYFISNTPVKIAVRAKSVTTVIQISHKDFIDCLKIYPLDYEKYCMIKDMIQFDGREIEVCFACKQFGHDVSNCPQIHFSIKKHHFAQKVFFSVVHHDRKMFKRRQLRENTLLSSHRSRQRLKMIRWEMVRDIYEDYSEIIINQQLEIYEKDKYFFKRCPKIKYVLLKKLAEQKDFIEEDKFSKSQNFNAPTFCQIQETAQLIYDKLKTSTESSSSSSYTDFSDSQLGQESQVQVPTSIIANPQSSYSNHTNNALNNNQKKKSMERRRSSTDQKGFTSFMKRKNEVNSEKQNSEIDSINLDDECVQNGLHQTPQIVLAKQGSQAKMPFGQKKSIDFKSQNKSFLEVSPLLNSVGVGSLKNFEFSRFPSNQDQQECNLHQNQIFQCISPQDTEQVKKIFSFISETVKEDQEGTQGMIFKMFSEFLQNQKFQYQYDEEQRKKSKPQFIQGPQQLGTSHQHRISYIDLNSNGNQLVNIPITNQHNRSSVFTPPFRQQSKPQKNNLQIPKRSTVISIGSENESKSIQSDIKQVTKDQNSQNPSQKLQIQTCNRFPPLYTKEQQNEAKVQIGQIFGKLGFSFDKIKEFIYFFPKNNYSNVVKSYKKAKQILNHIQPYKLKTVMGIQRAKDLLKTSKLSKRNK